MNTQSIQKWIFLPALLFLSLSALAAPTTWQCIPRLPKGELMSMMKFEFTIDGTDVKGRALSQFFGGFDPNHPTLTAKFYQWGDLSGSHDGYSWTLSPVASAEEKIKFALNMQLLMDDDNYKMNFVFDMKTADLDINSTIDGGDDAPSSHEHSHYVCQKM